MDIKRNITTLEEKILTAFESLSDATITETTTDGNRPKFTVSDYSSDYTYTSYDKMLHDVMYSLGEYPRGDVLQAIIDTEYIETGIDLFKLALLIDSDTTIDFANYDGTLYESPCVAVHTDEDGKTHLLFSDDTLDNTTAKESVVAKYNPIPTVGEPELIYTGGSIWIACKPVGKCYYMIDSEYPNCLSLFNMGEDDINPCDCNDMIWSKDSTELEPLELVTYYELFDMIKGVIE